MKVEVPFDEAIVRFLWLDERELEVGGWWVGGWVRGGSIIRYGEPAGNTIHSIAAFLELRCDVYCVVGVVSSQRGVIGRTIILMDECNVVIAIPVGGVQQLKVSFIWCALSLHLQ